MKKINKAYILLLFTCFGQENLSAQKSINTLTITADTTANTNYKKTRVNVIQGNQLTKSFLNEKIFLQSGVEFQLEFENKLIQIPGYKKLKIYSDTAISLDLKSLSEVIVKSKKRIVTETLIGFDYYPQNDSIYKDRSLLIALQRLPFIILENDYTLPKYKNDQKILFLINGKQRKGLENGWVDVLKAIRAKDIYKVELVEDLPNIYKNQGYNIVINILTIDANIHGESSTTALLYDQRKNLNKNAGATFLRKKSDFSVQGSWAGDKISEQLNTKIYNGDVLTINNSNTKLTRDKLANYSIDFGNRIDSANDIGLNIQYVNYYNSASYINNYNFPSISNSTKNLAEREKLRFNTSLVHRKNRSITKSISFAGTFQTEQVQNRVNFFNPKAYDSINNQAKPTEFIWIAEYNILNNTNPNFQKELGFQIYNKRLAQDFEQYTIDAATNENSKLLYSNGDTLFTRQISIKPYYKFGKNINTKKRLVLTLASELFIVNNNGNQNNLFYLPQIRLNYKKLVSSSLSVRYITELAFEKPGADFLIPVQNYTDPLQSQIGNIHLRPTKYINNTIEFVKRKKATISNSTGLYYSFDNINFFRKYEPSSNKLVSFANNGGNSYSIGNYFNYQMPSTKRFNFYFNANILYIYQRNKDFNTKFSGVTFSGGHSLQYSISPKYGNLSFLSFLNSNKNGAQGYYRGSVKYSFGYGIQLFKKRIAASLSAQNFFLKNRNVLTYTYDESYRSFTNTISPYRLILIRLAINFSNIKVAKYAAKKITEVTGEATNSK